MKPLRNVTRMIDPNGQPVVKVPLANTELVATVDSDSYDKLIETGISTNWNFNKASPKENGYVRTALNGSRVCVARLIVQAKPKENVHYLNGDTLDLRKENLYVAKGNSKRAWILQEISA